jgi:hypothetical protein
MNEDAHLEADYEDRFGFPEDDDDSYLDGPFDDDDDDEEDTPT